MRWLYRLKENFRWRSGLAVPDDLVVMDSAGKVRLIMAERARKAIDEFPTVERDIQSLTVGISKETFRLIKQEMQEFFSRVVRIVDDDKNADRVYNVNVHLFPMSVRQPHGESGDE